MGPSTRAWLTHRQLLMLSEIGTHTHTFSLSWVIATTTTTIRHRARQFVIRRFNAANWICNLWTSTQRLRSLYFPHQFMFSCCAFVVAGQRYLCKRIARYYKKSVHMGKRVVHSVWSICSTTHGHRKVGHDKCSLLGMVSLVVWYNNQNNRRKEIQFHQQNRKLDL